MRALELGMPSVWLPDIEPEASNTTTASSVQGAGLFSSKCDAEGVPARSTARTIATNLTIQRTNAMPARPDPIAQFCPRDEATLAKKPAWNRGSRVAGPSRQMMFESIDSLRKSPGAGSAPGLGEIVLFRLFQRGALSRTLAGSVLCDCARSRSPRPTAW